MQTKSSEIKFEKIVLLSFLLLCFIFLLHPIHSQISSAREAMEALVEISKLLNTGLDPESLAICVKLCEAGVNPEALASVVQELRREAALQQPQDST